MTKSEGSGKPVLIAGGGIGGLAAAYALAQVGRPSHVLEQGEEFGEVGAGIQLGPNVFKMFDRMGLTDAITDVAFFPDNLIMRDGLTGQEITRASRGERGLSRAVQVSVRRDLSRGPAERAAGSVQAVAA